jgi:hypothetical protein
MNKKSLPLIAMMLLSGPLAAQVVVPRQVIPTLEFVAAIETGAYSGVPPVSDYAPLDFATYLYLTQPVASIDNYTTLLGKLVDQLNDFNIYWYASGPNANLFDPLGDSKATGGDTPPVIADYIVDDLYNAENPPRVQAPEMNTNGATGALTLLAGLVLVLLGRRKPIA